MGRLIDADKLMEDVRKNSESYFADDFAKQWVDRQQTADAIPVKWIKEKIQSLRNENSYTSYHLSECFKALLIDWRRGKKREQTD